MIPNQTAHSAAVRRRYCGDQIDSSAGVADGAVVYGSTAIFRNGDDAGMLWANTLVDAGGEAAVTVEPDELETLARIAAPRM